MPHIKEPALDLSSLGSFLTPITHHTASLTHRATMPADYNGRWEMVSNENFEELMKAMGEYCLYPYGSETQS